MNKLILFSLAGLAAVVAFGGKLLYSASRLQFYISHIGIKFQGATPYVMIDVMVQNPTASAFDIASLIGQVYFNSTLLGNAAFYTATTVTGNAQTKIVLPIRISLLGVGAQLFDLLGGVRKMTASIRVVGTVNVNALPAPIDLTFSIV